MNILNVLFSNFSKKARTRTPSDRVDYPKGFRGELHHVTELCVGCTTCHYVCSPGAIQFQKLDGKHINWEYQAMQCTFCGKCVEYCPTNALSFEQYAPANKLESVPEVLIAHTVEYKKCASCGEPVIPLPMDTLEALYWGNPGEDIHRLNQLCEKCRNRATVERMKASLLGEHHPSQGEAA
ncbi:4Fe-4S dicluster domain-containing protein [bacterium]|nr:4Fe-4S dicluster domain-containing protein [bacterium]